MSKSSSSMELGSGSHLQNPNTGCHKDDAYWNSFPPGFHFKPSDEELISQYLKPKLFNEGLPPNRISEVQLYHHNPETLVALQSYGEGEWYFFTPRDKKYRNGSRPRRAAGDGFWKATGADRNVLSEGVEIGYRKALVFYRGKPPKGEKTDWMMHEYRLKDPPAISNAPMNEMRLDDWVLCKIYKKNDKSVKTPDPEDEEAIGLENQDMDPQQGLEMEPFHLGNQVEEDGGLNGLANPPQSYYHAMAMMEQNPPPWLDGLPPLPGNHDQFIDDDSLLLFNFDASAYFPDQSL